MASLIHRQVCSRVVKGSSLLSRSSCFSPLRAVSISSSSSSSSSSSGPFALRWTDILMTSAAALPLLAITVLAEDDEDKQRGDSLKSKFVGNYENRVRQSSAPLKVFEYFASQKVDGVPYMTHLDFIRSLTPYNENTPSKDLGAAAGKDKAVVDEKAFKATENLCNSVFFVNQNKHGLISFEEYLLFVTLLSIPSKLVFAAFHMFDQDGSGGIDLEEWVGFITTMKNASEVGAQAKGNTIKSASLEDFGDAVRNAGITRAFFGEVGQGEGKKISVEQFSKYMEKLHETVLRLQFDALESKKGDGLTFPSFAYYLLSFGSHKHHDYCVKKISSLDKFASDRISFKDLVAFEDILDSLDDIDHALRLFLTSGRPFTYRQFHRVAKAVTGIDLNPKMLEALFLLFDHNGDGRLDDNELMGFLKQNRLHGLTRHRDTGFWRFARCVQECYHSE